MHALGRHQSCMQTYTSEPSQFPQIDPIPTWGSSYAHPHPHMGWWWWWRCCWYWHRCRWTGQWSLSSVMIDSCRLSVSTLIGTCRWCQPLTDSLTVSQCWHVSLPLPALSLLTSQARLTPSILANLSRTLTVGTTDCSLREHSMSHLSDSRHNLFTYMYLLSFLWFVIFVLV